MKIVSYYTKEYKPHAETLGESLRKLGLRHEIDLVREQGSWRANTSLKPSFLRRKLDELKFEPAIAWIDADAVAHQNPSLFADLLKDEVEIAVFRYVSTTSYHSSDWHNFGQVWNGTIYLRVSPFVRQFVDEWILEQEKHPERLEQKNMASVLARVDPSKLYCLPPEYCWIEKYARPMAQNARPVIEHFMAHQKKRKEPVHVEKHSGPEALWCGHFYDHSGYAKANREVLLRVANSIRVGVAQRGISQESLCVDDYTRRRLDVHAATVVGDRAPLVRFYTPQDEDTFSDRYRICWTMLETHPKVHPDFIRLLNENYHEVWTPTRWNLEVFKNSGLKIPGHVTPLGVDPGVYRVGVVRPRPRARLLTTRRAGAIEPPKGLGYLTVCQPTFRKGLDVLIRAWEDAGRQDASLVIYTGNHEKLDAWGAAPWRWVDPEKAKTRIYHMTGRRTEIEMAQLYRSMDCYITATRGEGFNLPLIEAAACGLPVIVPYHTSHMEILTKQDRVIKPDDFRPIPYSKKVSAWYEGQSFAYYGKKAIRQFAEVIAGEFCSPLQGVVEGQYTWDRVAMTVARRLILIAKEVK